MLNRERRKEERVRRAARLFGAEADRREHGDPPRRRSRRRSRRRIVVLGLAGVLGISAVAFVGSRSSEDAGRVETPSVSTRGWPRPPDSATRARVGRVIDGDTVALMGIDVGRSTAGGRSSRIIGIDTPEVHGQTDCFGREASAFAKRVLDGREVWVDFDVQTRDRYGRALVYIWTLDGTFVNAWLAVEGYAMQMTIPPNVMYAELFTRLVSEAREANRGLWSACR